jgi:hypothetical protein
MICATWAALCTVQIHLLSCAISLDFAAGFDCKLPSSGENIVNLKKLFLRHFMVVVTIEFKTLCGEQDSKFKAVCGEQDSK